MTIHPIFSRLGGLGRAALLCCVALGLREALALPPNFQEVVAVQGLTQPPAVRFSPDGRVFVAEKSGLIKVFDNLADTSATVVADLRPNVHDFWDRGLLGFAIDAEFETRPYLYVLYTYDYDPLEPSHPAPRWGDGCPDKNGQNQIIGPGATVDGCVVNGRVSRLQVNPDNTLNGGEQVILENNWCQQFPSHSIGSLVFGPEGALYVTAGDGASFNTEDWGQFGGTRGTAPQTYPFTPANPCSDPNAVRGTATTKPAAEGGALRSQDVRTSADPASFNGSVLRIDPDSGAAWPDNPLVGVGPADDDRIIAYGLRNPFRATRRPGTSEIWIGDVGWGTWEEINRIVSPTAATVENFGWPCLEGQTRLGGYNGTPPNNLNLCTTLPTANTTPAYYRFQHGVAIYGGDPCTLTNGSAVSGLAFYEGGTYPASYNGALFFADHSRNCVWVMTAGGDGLPDIVSRTVFVSHTVNSQQLGNPLPVDLEIGPGGDLFLVDFEGGRVRRIKYNVGNNPPTAVIDADPTNGPVPLTVQFDGSGSSDPDDGATLFYAWDLDGDGQYDDAFLPQASRTYSAIGDVTVGLRVTDDDGAGTTTSVVVSAGNSVPTATIATPLASVTWRVGDAIGFSGSGSDTTDGTLGPGALHWDIILNHCPGGGGCHQHIVESHDGVAGGTFTAPDHEYYSSLEFRLTVTDSGGLTDVDSVTVESETVDYAYESTPPGLTLSVSGHAETTPFVRPSIVGSLLSFVADSPQNLAGTDYYFVSWADGGPASRQIVTGEVPLVFHANYVVCETAETSCDGLDNDCDGTPDDVAVPAGAPALGMAPGELTWNALLGAESYDLVRGDLATLHSDGFTLATLECLASAAAETTQAYDLDPAPGQGFWFLVRGRNCGGPGSYDSGASSQLGSRDAAIDASPAACP